MKLYNIHNKFFFVLIGSVIIAFSCKKVNDIGLLGEQSPVYKINQNKNLQGTAQTLKLDSLPSNGVSDFLLGSYVDPVFGKTEASFISTFFIHSGVFPTRDSIRINLASVELYMRPKAEERGYGDFSSSNRKLRLKVYELNNPVDAQRPYYTNQKAFGVFVDLVSVPLIETDIIPSAASVDSTGFKFNLSTELGSIGERLIEAINSGALREDNLNTLQNFFKGLYFTCDDQNQQSGEGTILHFNSESDNSFLRINYKRGTSAGHFDLVTGGKTVGFNMFNHTYVNTPVLAQVNNPNINQELIYIQSGAGFRAKINFPFLSSFRNKDSGTIAINKFEISLQLDQESLDSKFPPFKKLALLKIDSLGRSIMTPDETSAINYDGNYSAATKSYTFNLSRYAQQITNGVTKDYGLYLQATKAVTSANRVVIKGKQNILVNLIYTKVK